MPSLVLLDLNLPYVQGIDVLRWIRAQPRLDSTIVIPLTSSPSPIDIEAAHMAGANDYLVKPLGIKAWQKLASQIVSLWLNPSANDHPQWGALGHVNPSFQGRPLLITNYRSLPIHLHEL